MIISLELPDIIFISFRELNPFSLSNKVLKSSIFFNIFFKKSFLLESLSLKDWHKALKGELTLKCELGLFYEPKVEMK